MSRIVVFLADGFEESEAIVPIDYLRRAGHDVVTASIMGTREVKGAHDITVQADVVASQVNPASADAVVIPGGTEGAQRLRDSKAVGEFVTAMAEAGKLVAAICAGPIVLEKAGLLAGKPATCYPGVEGQLSISEWVRGVHVEGNVITGEGPAFAPEFAFEIVRYLEASALPDLQKALLTEDLAAYMASKA